jgi:hypothetical protein
MVIAAVNNNHLVLSGSPKQLVFASFAYAF